MTHRRLFFALWPDHRQRERLREVIGAVSKTVEGDLIDRRSWHVTLSFVGAFPDARLPELLALAGEIEPRSIRLNFDRLEYWPRPRIACLMTNSVPAAVQELVEDLEALKARFALAPEERNFRPHITVARRARAFQAVRISRPVPFEFSDFLLLESVRGGPGGPRYQPLDMGRGN